MRLKQTLKELQRRHVVKAALAYLVVSWLIIQVLSILFPAFDASSNAMKTTIIVLGVGFPIWLVIAWVYDFSPKGIVKTKAATYDPEIYKKKNVGLNRFITGGLLIAVILLVFNTFRVTSKMNRIDSIYQKALAINFSSSVAVLAFDNLSPDSDQDYFAKGLSEQIQRRLTRQKDLKVINTNSSFVYKDKGVSIEVIGKELDVSFVIEGSVLKSGETIRVDVDLVSTKDGSSIWSKQFNKNGEDVLYIYDEIAKAVVKYLKLTFDYEDVRLRKVDPEAYDLYLRAENVLLTFDHDGSIKADSLIRKSLAIDSAYSPSWTTLSKTTLHKGVYEGYYELDEAIALGLRSAKQAIELNPDNPEGYAWLSNWQWHNREVQVSNDNMYKALELEPNNSAILMHVGFQVQRLNKIEESIAFYEKAIHLDPKNVDAWIGRFESEMMNDFTIAELSIKKVMELSPQAPFGKYLESYIVYNSKGDVKKAFEILNEQPDFYYRLMTTCLILFSENKTEEAFSTLEAFINLPVDEHPEYSYFDFEAAIIYAEFGNNDKAFYHLNKAYDDTVVLYLEWFFTWPPFKNLYDDPRWDEYIDRLSEDFNYDFKHKT